MRNAMTQKRKTSIVETRMKARHRRVKMDTGGGQVFSSGAAARVSWQNDDRNFAMARHAPNKRSSWTSRK